MVVGDKVADKVLEGCMDKILYQRVAEKVNCCVAKANQKLANETFCAITKLQRETKMC